jgi:ribosome modulation factor
MRRRDEANEDAITHPRDIEAYRLGLHDGRQGKVQEANPYRHGDPRCSWFTGWYEARHERMFHWPPRWQ